MQGRALGTLLRGRSRDLASSTAAGSVRPTATTTTWLQYCAISTTSSLRSSDDSDPRQPSNPRERARAAAESLGGLSGGRASEQTPLSERINRQFAAPTNVRSLPRRPLEHPGENNGGSSSGSSSSSSNSGRGGNGPRRFVKPPSSLASRGAIVRAPSTLGRGGGGGFRGGTSGGGFTRLGGDAGGRGGGGGGSRFGFGGPRGDGGRGGRGDRGGLGQGRGRGRRGRGGKDSRDQRGGDDYKLEGSKIPGLGESAEEKAWMATRDQGERRPYVPSLTAGSLTGWGPAMPSSAGSRGVVETAMRSMRILGGGQPFEPGWNNDPVDNAERYEAGKPVFFADPAERQWLVENSDLDEVRGASEETQQAIVDAALRGKIAAPPRYVPLGTDPLATVNMYLAREATYGSAQSKAFADKFASLLPGAARRGAGNAATAPKQARP